MIEQITAREAAELARREGVYRGTRPAPDVRNKTVIVVDDGLATGATMLAAVRALRQNGPREIIVAAPVGSRNTCSQFSKLIDQLCVCAITPEPFYGVGSWYRDFDQTTDEEVCRLLDEANAGGVSRIAA
jgi:predicted phosphoribosyltransferase